MFELDGQEYSFNDIYIEAEKQGVDAQEYLEYLKTQGLVEKKKDVAEPGAAVASETPAPVSGVSPSVDTSLESQPRITGLAEVDALEIEAPKVDPKDIARQVQFDVAPFSQ